MKHKYMSEKEARMARIAVLAAALALVVIGMGGIIFVGQNHKDLIHITGGELLSIILSISAPLSIIIGLYIGSAVSPLYRPAESHLIEGLEKLTFATEKKNLKEALERGCIVTVRDVIYLHKVHDKEKGEGGEIDRRLKAIETVKEKLSR